jgi:heme/copper-type cytochrome/quinol oxidase subunit 4
MAFGIFLYLHSYVRWLVVIFALLAVGSSFLGWFGKRPWTAVENRLGLLFTVSFDFQVLLGAILYFFLSPLTTAALRNFGAAMKNDLLRFFSVEHLAIMLVAVVIAHIGRFLSLKASSDQGRFKRAAIFYTLAILLVLVSIPWPFLSVGRPLLRF